MLSPIVKTSSSELCGAKSAEIFDASKSYLVYVSETFIFIYPLAAPAIANLMVYIPPKRRKWTAVAYLLIATIVTWPLFWLEGFALHI